MNWIMKNMSLWISMVFGLFVGFYVPWPWKVVVFGAWALGLFQSWYTHRRHYDEILTLLERITIIEEPVDPPTQPGRSNKR